MRGAIFKAVVCIFGSVNGATRWSVLVNSARRQGRVWLPLLAFSLTMSACSGLPKGLTDFDVGIKQRGMASWYGVPFDGQVTASGEIYDMEALSGAHRTLQPGTVVKVTNAENGKQVRVRINDRGPYVGGRIMDLSYAAARALQMVQAGIAAVQVEVIGNQASEPHLSVDRFTLVPRLFDLVGDAPESTYPGTVRTQGRRVPPHEARREKGIMVLRTSARPPRTPRQAVRKLVSTVSTGYASRHLEPPP